MRTATSMSDKRRDALACITQLAGQYLQADNCWNLLCAATCLEALRPKELQRSAEMSADQQKEN